MRQAFSIVVIRRARPNAAGTMHFGSDNALSAAAIAMSKANNSLLSTHRIWGCQSSLGAHTLGCASSQQDAERDPALLFDHMPPGADPDGTHTDRQILLWDQNGHPIRGMLDADGDIKLWDKDKHYIWGNVTASGDIRLWDKSNAFIWGTLSAAGEVELRDKDGHYILGHVTA